ncbi:MAG TPA: hypothetical protein EYH05_12360 [Anaerolineae bacterium]|nr:hypothetical protein [Anaerolineae bacterium]
MSRAKGLYKISRPTTSLAGALAVLMGGYVAGTGEWLNVILAVIATFLASAAANAWNDYLDIEIDRINQPKRPLPAGKVSPRAALIFSFALTGLALLIAAFVSWSAFLVALVTAVALYIYSWKLKSTVLMGNATIATVSAVSAIFGGVAAGNVRPSLWLALIIFVTIMGREVLKTPADYEGDLRGHCRTVATVWGLRRARIIFYILAGLTLIMMLLPSILRIYKPIYGVIVILGVFPVLIYIILRVSPERTGPQLEKLSQLMKYDFMIWFTAVLLGASA